MAFTKRTIKDRLLQYPKRYRLNLVAGETNVYDLEQITGSITEAGTPINSGYLQPLEDAVASIPVFQNAGGTGTAITLDTNLIDGYSCTFIVKANNSGASTTINGKPLYKPATTTAPVLTANKAVTVWYSTTGDCFFIKASAEGNAVAGNVLASKTFSNDNDTGLTGTMPNRTNTVIGADYFDTDGAGTIRIRPQEGYYPGNGTERVTITDTDFIANNFLATKNIFGLQGSIPVRTGNTPSTANDGTSTLGRLYLRPQIGYYDGSSDFTYVDDVDFTKSNIAFGKNIFGLLGLNMGVRQSVASPSYPSNLLGTSSYSISNSTLVAYSGLDTSNNGGVITTPWTGLGTWTRRFTLSSGACAEIATNGSIYVMVLTGHDNLGRIFSSPDLITWTLRHTSPSWQYDSVSYGNGVFIVTGNRNNYYVTSTNGTTWTERLKTFPTADYLRRSRWVNNTAVIVPVGSMNWYFTTTDGITLTQRTSPSGTQLTLPRITKSTELFALSNGAIYKTTDGINWTTVTPNIAVAGFNNYFNQIVYSSVHGLYFAMWYTGGTASNELYTSPDFVTWTKNSEFDYGSFLLELKQDGTKALSLKSQYGCSAFGL